MCEVRLPRPTCALFERALYLEVMRRAYRLQGSPPRLTIARSGHTLTGNASRPTSSRSTLVTDRPPTLPAMFDDGLAGMPRQHKRARQTSREVYRLRRAEDIAARTAGRETRRGAVLRTLAHYWNVHQTSPTAYEAFTFAVENGEAFRDICVYRPRLTSLLAEGIVETSGKRRCSITGALVVTWRVREQGSKEPR